MGIEKRNFMEYEIAREMLMASQSQEEELLERRKQLSFEYEALELDTEHLLNCVVENRKKLEEISTQLYCLLNKLEKVQANKEIFEDATQRLCL